MKGSATKRRDPVAHWCRGAKEDWRVGIRLLRMKSSRHAFFFIHLALEKMLKAHCCAAKEGAVPRIHSLTLLADGARLRLPADMLEFLAEFNRFNIICRYPEHDDPVPRGREAARFLKQAREVFRWLTRQLSE